MKTVLFTSLVPRDLAAQVEAMASWRAVASGVVTVNTEGERSALGPLPEWIAAHTYRENVPHERPFVRLSRIAEAVGAQAGPDDIALLCNSDVFLADPAAAGELTAGAADLAFMSRIDTDPAGRPLGAFARGYDVFCFRARQGELLAADDLYFGLPWWDYWLPLNFLAAGASVLRPEPGPARHRHHAQRWEMKLFHDHGRLVLEKVTGAAPRPPLRRHEVDAFAGEMNDFLNSGHFALAGMAGQGAAFAGLAALWRARYAAGGRNAASLALAEWGGSTARLISGALAGAPALHRLAQGLYRRAAPPGNDAGISNMIDGGRP